MRVIKLFLLTVLFCVACNSNTKKLIELVQQWEGRNIYFPNSSIFGKFGVDTIFTNIPNTKYKILNYVDSIGCLSCRLHLKKWKSFIQYVDSISNNNVSFLFYFHTSDFDEINYLLRRDRFMYPVCFDRDNELYNLNKLPDIEALQTFLLDHNNKIIALGNPINNYKIKELYLDIIQGNKKVIIENPTTVIEFQSNEINLGHFNRTFIKNIVFEIKNIGNNPLLINDVITECSCVEVSYNDNPTHSGDIFQIFAEVKVDFKGYFEESIRVYCNASNSPVILKISGWAD